MKDRKGFRKIVVNAQEWQYKVGMSYVVAFGPEDIKLCNSCDDVLQAPVDEIDRRRRKGNPGIVPSDIADWINRST